MRRGGDRRRAGRRRRRVEQHLAQRRQRGAAVGRGPRDAGRDRRGRRAVREHRRHDRRDERGRLGARRGRRGPSAVRRRCVVLMVGAGATPCRMRGRPLASVVARRAATAHATSTRVGRSVGSTRRRERYAQSARARLSRAVRVQRAGRAHSMDGACCGSFACGGSVRTTHTSTGSRLRTESRVAPRTATRPGGPTRAGAPGATVRGRASKRVQTSGDGRAAKPETRQRAPRESHRSGRHWRAYAQHARSINSPAGARGAGLNSRVLAMVFAAALLASQDWPTRGDSTGAAPDGCSE